MEKKMKELARKSVNLKWMNNCETGRPFLTVTYLLNRFGALGGFFNVFGPFLAAAALTWTGILAGSIKGPPVDIERPLGIVTPVQVGSSAEHENGRRRFASWCQF